MKVSNYMWITIETFQPLCTSLCMYMDPKKKLEEFAI